MTADHPPKNQAIRPLPDLNAVSRLRQILRRRPRDLLLFDLAVHTGMDMSFLIRLKVKDLMDLPAGALLPVARSRGKDGGALPVFSQQCRETFQWYLQVVNPSAEDYLFPSRKGGGALNLPSVSHIIKKWFDDADLTGLSGARSLKKTWAVYFRPQNPSTTGIDARDDPMQTLKPVETKTVQENVYQELFQAIISGRIAPAERLVTEKIARQLGVSSMPVREALYRLQAGGLVITRKKIGSVVAELSPENLAEITEIRLALETMAARKATTNHSKQVIEHLEDLHAAFLAAWKSGNIEKILALNHEFHHTIYREAEMPILLPIIDGLWGRLSPYLHMLLREQGYTASGGVIKTHQGMVRAMKRNDPEKMVACLRNDITTANKALMGMFNQLRK